MTKQELIKFRRRRKTIMVMAARGKNYAEIGRKYGISRQRVREIVETAYDAK